MADREKVIKELEVVRNAIVDGYIHEPDRAVNAITDALAVLEEQPEIVRCKDCDNKECWGRACKVVCGIDGTPHIPDWFCAYGERQEGR